MPKTITRYLLICIWALCCTVSSVAETSSTDQSALVTVKQELEQVRTDLDGLEKDMTDYEQEVGESGEAANEFERATRERELRALIGKVEILEERRAQLKAQLEALEGRLGGIKTDEGVNSGSVVIKIFDASGASTKAVIRGQTCEARIDIMSLPRPCRLDLIQWRLDRPAGEPVELEVSGAKGLDWPLQSSAESALGTYNIHVTVTTDVGVFRGSTQFILIEKPETDEDGDEEVEPGDDAIAIDASVQGPLYTGRRALVSLSSLPFEVEDVRALSFSGLGKFSAADFWIFEPSARRIWFRPKKAGAQTPRFMLTYKNQQAVAQFPCNVELTQLEPEVHLDQTDLEQLTVPFELEIPEYLRATLKAHPSASRVVRLQGAPQAVSGGSHILRGSLNAEWMLPGRRYKIDLIDGTDAEAVAEFDIEYREFGIELPKKLPPADEDIQLELREWRAIARQLQGFEAERVGTTPNVRHEAKGANDLFWLMTGDEDDPDHQYVRIVGIGERGIAKGEKNFDIDCECQNVPSYVRSTLRKTKNPWPMISRIKAAVQREDDAEAQRIARQYIRDMSRVFEWWASLDECRHLSRHAREYFGTMVKLFELSEQEEPPESEAMRLINQLRQPLTKKDIKKGFMGDEFEDILSKELGN